MDWDFKDQMNMFKEICSPKAWSCVCLVLLLYVEFYLSCISGLSSKIGYSSLYPMSSTSAADTCHRIIE